MVPNFVKPEGSQPVSEGQQRDKSRGATGKVTETTSFKR